MNEQKIDCQERIFQQSHHHGLLSVCNFEVVGNQSNPSQILNMGIWVQQPSMDHGLSQPHQQLQNLGPPKSPSSIMSRFESPASAFYATERCMGFPQYDTQIEEANFNETYTSMDDHNDPSFDIRNTLQSIVKSQSQSQSQSPTYHPYHKSSHKSYQIPLLSTQQQIKLHGDNSLRTPPFASFPSKETQDQGMSLFSQQGKQSSPRIGSGNVSATCCDSPSTSPVLSNKTRIRWNQDLHEKFVDCVNRLGGADKATPKAILKMMGLDGLTIFHIKSHLQKYRIAKYLPDSAEGKLEKRTNTLTVEPRLDVKTGLQIKEALQLQLDVQRRLHEQLEIQRNLQMRIEEQGKQLKKMFDLQQQTGTNLLKTHNLDTPCHEDAPSNSLSDTQISTSQCSGNTNFPSKIS